MRRWLSLAARLYPKAWRERYGVEFACLLDGVEPRGSDVLDVLRGAVTMQIKAMSGYLKLVGAAALAGAIVAIIVSFLLPGRYVSSAVIQGGRKDDPQSVDQIHQAWRDVLSRSSLSEVIQRPNLDLYKGERRRQPLEDVIEAMKTKDLKVQMLNDRGASAARVSFAYPDRYKAQAVMDALTRKLAGQAHLAVAPASLPGAPIAPNRLAFMFWGLGIGLLTGVVGSLFLWRARWTMKVIGFGLAGCLIAAGFSLLIPNRYISRCVMRVIPTPKADGVQRYMQDAELSAWMQKKEHEVLSNEGLLEIMQNPGIKLYRKERESQPLEVVIGMMRQNLKIERPPDLHSAFVISFTGTDRFEAQRVVSVVVTKFVDSEIVITEADLMKAPAPHTLGTTDDCIGKTGDAYVSCITAYMPMPRFAAAESGRGRRTGPESINLLDPASLPETPVAPNRFVLAGAGLFLGLFLGAYALRRKPPESLRHA
jgi:hypothetical protein